MSGEMPCATVFRLVGSACLQDVKAHHRGARNGDTVAVHQTRVALTRFRAAIAFFGPMVEDPEWTRLKSELKWLNGYLGATRDLDVAIGNAPRERLFRTARAESQRQLRRALTSDRYRRWFKDIVDWVNHGPWSHMSDHRLVRLRASPACEYHARRLAGWHEKLVKRSRGLQGMGGRKQHRVRLASKRLRYAIEFSEDVLPKDDFARWRAIVKQLRKAQQILGELHDAEAARALAAELQQRIKTSRAGRQRKPLELLDKKEKERLLRRAAVAYRRIAA
ncbi:CHAD domain-containing protein [Bradyrhizobium sp. Arg237L]|uniref:CHAD domain-containing protein n=1 Tax=Bradyrhizobium sp. Arg237L TaxID=3003352 RepID=UPI00249F1E94|nr:CHAD domain-containing protein [Bradyrhizobium sp. Arg237L]MDI4237657.1 CHAD domain-containing protein [Bradyrhizobium sp. Arg237L]